MKSMLQIKKSTFVTSLASSKDFFDTQKPEILIFGRSNVGKSSFINFLANNGKLAKTSSMPGRTRLINLFCMNDAFLLVDFPGFGFARVNDEEKNRWKRLIEGYVEYSKRVVHVFHLVDIRHDPTQEDCMLTNYLFAKGLPYTIVATKADKISKPQIHKQLTRISAALRVGMDNILVVSSEKKTGKEAVLQRLEQVLTCATQDGAMDETMDDAVEFD